MARDIRLYMDEHVHPVIAAALRLRGVDVLTTKEAAMLGATDEEQIAYSVAQRRTLFTQDTDFLRIHASGIKHKGIVYAHKKTATRDVIRSLMLLCQVLDANDMRDHLEFL
jgi:predicted nuclease of predicted toxin-antitoxin system